MEEYEKIMPSSEMTPQSEEKFPSTAVNYAQSTWNIVRSVGPFLISQSDSMSEAYARHCSRVASVELGKALLQGEIQVLIETEKQMMKQFVDANPVERLRIRRDMEDISASLRQSKIGTQALDYLQLSQEKAAQALPPQDAPLEISTYWIDKFNELARAHNEPWRENLLSRALAKEALHPNSVSPRVLWLLGTLDEKTFNAFATFLDATSEVAGRRVLLTVFRHLNQSLFPGVSLSQIIFALDDSQLISSFREDSWTFEEGKDFHACHGDKCFSIHCPGSGVVVRGFFLTELGKVVASFCDVKTTPLGAIILEEWVDSLRVSQFVIRPISNWLAPTPLQASRNPA